MIEAPLFAPNGAKHKAGFALPADQFDGAVNEPVLHQAVKTYLANQRQGTAATKTRRYVTGGNQKPWRQKGTGRARQGSTRAPHWPGGGTVFGPHPRDYRLEMPKKVRQLARRSALNARAREGGLVVIDRLELEAPKTARLAGLLESMGLEGKKVLVLTHGAKQAVYLSGRNMQRVKVLPYPEAAAYDIIWADALVVEGEALGASPVDAPEGAAEAAPAPKAAKKKAAPKAKAKPKAATRTKAASAKKTAKPAAKAAKGAKAPARKKKGSE